MAGIACAGHWVLDRIKFIDYWPNPSELSNILSMNNSNGGAPFNILVDLANLKTDIPSYGIGCIGNDLTGQQILTICAERHLNIQFLHVLSGKKTSYTDVMTLQDSGVRTMFHFHGANDKFSQKFVPIDQLKSKGIKIFYLGHLLLMDALEKKDKEFKIAAGRLLHDVKQAGMQTVVDIATESSDRYQKIVVPVLPYIDHFVINELEAQKTSGITIRQKNGSAPLETLKKAAEWLLDHGIQKNVIIHMPEGTIWMNKEKHGLWYPSFRVPDESFRATCGAGDAFCSGVLVGLHENWPMKDVLHLAVATAAMSVTSPHNSDGIKPLNETIAIADKYVPQSDIIKF